MILHRLTLLKHARNSRVIPGIGFSNNLYPEMFCGQNPDEIGFFNEWSPKQIIRPGLLGKILKPFDIFRRFTYLNAGFRIILLRKIFKVRTANIPFKYYKYFKAEGSHNFRRLGEKSLLNKYNFSIVDSSEFPMNRTQRNIRDIKAFKDVEKMSVKNINLFLSLTELDNISHAFGMNSPEYESHIKYLDTHANALVERFKGENKDSNIYVLSDHGMVSVSSVCNVDLESVVGYMHPTRYLYFIDSTYLRIWIKDNKIEKKIMDYLKSIKNGEIVSESERNEFGITHKEFGDIIFRANEGVMFVPNFFGGRKSKGMHGYASCLKSQSAIFSELHKTDVEEKLPDKSKEIFYYLSKVLEHE